MSSYSLLRDGRCIRNLIELLLNAHFLSQQVWRFFEEVFPSHSLEKLEVVERPGLYVMLEALAACRRVRYIYHSFRFSLGKHQVVGTQDKWVVFCTRCVRAHQWVVTIFLRLVAPPVSISKLSDRDPIWRSKTGFSSEKPHLLRG